MRTDELFCALNETFPEDGPSGSLQGKKFGNAQMFRASLLSFMRTKKKYYLKISETVRSQYAMNGSPMLKWQWVHCAASSTYSSPQFLQFFTGSFESDGIRVLNTLDG